MSTRSHKHGFTLTETMVATAVFALFATAAMAVYRTVLIEAGAGSSQARFLNMARNTEVSILRYLQAGTSFSAVSNTLTIWSVDGTRSTISYVDADNNPATVVNNLIVYDPNPYVGGDQVTLANFVRPLDDGSALFTNVPDSSPNTVRISFHVGDGTNAIEATTVGTGRGYQGTEVRFSVTAHNCQRWYQ